jgi:hypothetical protein
MKSAGSNLNLNSASFFKPIILLVAAMLSIFVGWFIASYANPFTTTILVAAIVMNVVAIVNPRGGLYLLVVTTGYLDLVKRLGILTDSLSGLDITVTLAVAPLLMQSICVGVVIKNILEKRKLENWQRLVLALVIVAICAAAFESFRGGAGFLNGAQSLVNSGGYLPLVLITSMIFPEPEEALKVLRFALWVFLPVALYSIWQQIFGLSDFEVRFLESGYTITVTDLDDIRPRPFSTLNSPHALSVCTAILAGVALLVPFKGGNRVVWQYPVALVYVAGCVATLGRSGIFIIPIFLIGWLCFRWKWSTFAFYGTILGALLLLMVNAEPVLESLGSLQRLLPMDNNDVSTEVFRLGTFSERLMSFHNALTNPRFHTLFGDPEVTKQDEEDSYDETVAHDQITQTLVRYGFVGLVVSGIIAVSGLWIAHRTVLSVKDRTIREIAIALLSVVTSVVYSGMLFGTHLDQFPVDFFFALLVGILVLCCERRLSPDFKEAPLATLA